MGIFKNLSSAEGMILLFILVFMLFFIGVAIQDEVRKFKKRIKSWKNKQHRRRPDSLF